MTHDTRCRKPLPHTCAGIFLKVGPSNPDHLALGQITPLHIAGTHMASRGWHDHKQRSGNRNCQPVVRPPCLLQLHIAIRYLRRLLLHGARSTQFSCQRCLFGRPLQSMTHSLRYRTGSRAGLSRNSIVLVYCRVTRL